MTSLVLDAGALIALDRNDRATWALLRVAVDEGGVVATPTGPIAQTWRDGPRQARLARALHHAEEMPLDGRAARAAGLLCGRSGTADVIDASVVVAAATLARSGDATVLTSDPDDLERLASVIDAPIGIVVV